MAIRLRRRRGRSRTAWIIGLLGGLVVAVAAGRADAVCVNAVESAALETRVLQTELMVAALTCDRTASYNAFVHKFQDELVFQGGNLRSFFRRTYTPGAEGRLNRFVTRLANEASNRSLDRGSTYCKVASLMFSAALATRDLGRFVALQPFVRRHGFARCDQPPALRTRLLPATVWSESPSQRPQGRGDGSSPSH